MPRFTVKDLLISTSFVACGLATVMLARSIHRLSIPNKWTMVCIAVGIWAVGFAIAGAGLFYPFKKNKIGALIGFIVAIALILEEIIVFYNTRP